MESGTALMWVVVATLGAVGALAAGAALKQSKYGNRKNQILAEERDVGSIWVIGNITGQNYFPLRVRVTPNRLVFSTLGVWVQIPFRVLRCERSRSLFLTFYFFSPADDESIRIRISARAASKLVNLSKGQIKLAS